MSIRERSRFQFRDLLHRRGGPLTDELRRTTTPRGQLPKRLLPEQVFTSVCGYCSTGCLLDVHTRNGAIVNILPGNGPVNATTACPKGWESHVPMQSVTRLTTPLLRNGAGRLVPVDWGTALQTFVDRFRAIMRCHGAESVAFLSTGQIPNEEMALLGALTKFGMGWIHGDGNTRQCMATAVSAYKLSFGFDAPPYTWQDLDETDLAIIVGANPAIAHPVMWRRLLLSRRKPEIVVIDPRLTETAQAATHHLRIRPRGDLALFLALAHELIRIDAIDHAFIRNHVSGFETLEATVRDWTPEAASVVCGLAPGKIRDLALRIAGASAVSFWWTQGVNQSHQGVRTAQAIINLALITGQIGRPGTGPNSITGQTNAMGSRLFSNTTSLYCGRDFTNSVHRKEVAAITGVPIDRIPDVNSLAYPEIVDGISRGDIRGLWVIATNPAHSWPDRNRVMGRLCEHLDFLVVQDLYGDTETARQADLVLPAAGWGEKRGTVINSERRIALVEQATTPPGNALPDFTIFRLIAAAWGCEDVLSRWQTPEGVFELLRQLSIGTPCDFSAIRNWDLLRRTGGVQWPCRTEEEAVTTARRLFSEGRFFTPDGRARIEVEAPRPPEDALDESFPICLISGRGSAAEWHTGTRTSRAPVLRRLSRPARRVDLHPDDAAAYGIADGDRVIVQSRRDRIEVVAQLTTAVPPGTAFMSMHDEPVNRLTPHSYDPISRQPAYKHTAVTIAPAAATTD